MQDRVEDGPVAQPAMEEDVRSMTPVGHSEEDVVAGSEERHGDRVAHGHHAGAVADGADGLFIGARGKGGLRVGVHVGRDEEDGVEEAKESDVQGLASRGRQDTACDGRHGFRVFLAPDCSLDERAVDEGYSSAFAEAWDKACKRQDDR